ncbi:hypothetical protein J6590_030780 [Homalodisca vitripennis]|nr:hypothetical protein J6590_030780 [Homalodisca vitripennis]
MRRRRRGQVWRTGGHFDTIVSLQCQILLLIARQLSAVNHPSPAYCTTFRRPNTDFLLRSLDYKLKHLITNVTLHQAVPPTDHNYYNLFHLYGEERRGGDDCLCGMPKDDPRDQSTAAQLGRFCRFRLFSNSHFNFVFVRLTGPAFLLSPRANRSRPPRTPRVFRPDPPSFAVRFRRLRRGFVIALSATVDWPIIGFRETDYWALKNNLSDGICEELGIEMRNGDKWINRAEKRM